MALQGFGVGAENGKTEEIVEQPPDFKQLVADERALRDRLAPRMVLKRWKSSNAPQQTSGAQNSTTSYIVNTDQDKINALIVSVTSGTLWVFLQEAEASGSEIPDMVFGAMTPNNPVVQPVPLDRYCITLFASGGTCKYSVLGVAL